ncbi:hypothetical protein C8R48DRAFT_141224 [Suillus tomentosus]|nr:hypothetical protein C8R48DRAFT_141224 [Suillus tomentosus]
MAFLQQVDSNCVEICLLTHYCPVSTYALHICATSVTRLLRAYTCLCVSSLDSFSLVHVHFSVYLRQSALIFWSYLLLLVADYLYMSYTFPLLSVCCFITCPCSMHLPPCIIAHLMYILRRSRVFGILLRSRHAYIRVLLLSIQLF